MPGPATASEFWNQVLAGRNPFGTAGPISFDPNNHAPNPWFTGHENSEGGWAWDSQSASDPRLHLGGNTAFVDGNMVPIGGMRPDEFSSNIRDPSQLVYDPRYGLMIPDTDIRSQYATGAGDLTFALGALGLGGPALAAAFGGAGVPALVGDGMGTAGAGMGATGGGMGALAGGEAGAGVGAAAGGAGLAGSATGGAGVGTAGAAGAAAGAGAGAAGAASGATDWLGIARAGLGIGSGLANVLGNGRNNSTSYVPRWQGGADEMWQGLFNTTGGAYNQQTQAMLPFLMNAFNAGAGEVPGVQGRMRDIANIDINQANNLFGAGDRLRGAGDTLWNTANDPQGALRARLLGETQENSRAASSLRGIGMGAASVGLENQAVGDFSMNWQDRQLGRQYQGLQGMSNAYRDAGMNTQAGVSDLGAAAGMNVGALGLPFNFADSFSGSMNSGIYGPASGLMGNLGNYMTGGRAGGQQAFNQNGDSFGDIFAGLGTFTNSGGWGALSRFFGGDSGGGGGGDGSWAWA